ncbi:hypothetical protein LJ707_01895 [Mucilaginibacter sp. UR6-1]|uniref:hypothetical protein n=1 Tax=Mucilaginibacter sp. UR6-1 TaxID=1435643 RepID=UPI001E2F3026|nr:hypothetical protein [Mucilaginibacter sp. UR6-1]MCC8407663.1 hypothetical protein [Mucilaginibacter sp. UR6-1]
MFARFENRNISQLNMQRHGWLKPEYILGDDVRSYGKLTFKTISFKHMGWAELADGTLSFKLDGFWRNRIMVTDGQDALIGTLKVKAFSFTSVFTLADGTELVLKKTSFWKARYRWESNMYGPLLRIHVNAFSKTDEVFIEQNTAPLHWVPLLTFLAFYLIITKQRQAAASGA